MASSINFDNENFGKLFIRIFLGVYFMVKGVCFFVSRHHVLAILGIGMQAIGVKFSPLVFGGILAGMCIVCGLTVVIGFLLRTSCFLLGSISLLESAILFLAKKNIWNVHIFIIGMVAFGMMFIGGGKFSAKS